MNIKIFKIKINNKLIKSIKMTFKTNTIEDTEKVYTILHEMFPKNNIDISYNWDKKEYELNVAKKQYIKDPEIPLDIKIKVVYGDSVSSDTPILLKYNNLIYIKKIEDLFNKCKAVSYPFFKFFSCYGNVIENEKEYCLSKYEVWTDEGWKKIKKVIRHKTNKKMYRVSTLSGIVDVTEDHSLLDENRNKIKPKDLNNNITLLHSFPIYINNKNYYLNPSLKLVIEDESKKKFSDKLKVQEMYYKLRSFGIYKNIIYNEGFYYFVDEFYYGKNNYNVLSVEELGECNDYVYDLETTNGRFQAGIGELIVKNTDSVMISINFNRDDYLQNRKDSFKIAIECGNQLTHNIFDRPPIEMEFEKIFQPFILLTKKRYIGYKYDNIENPDKSKGLDVKGIALTRRDYCQMVKNCYNEIIHEIVNDGFNGIEKSIEIFKKYIDNIDKYKINIDHLVLSAQLAKSYKTRPVHVILAEKLKQRKEEVQVGDRIPYIFIENLDQNVKLAKSELGEDPQYAKLHKLKYNRLCYLEQLSKPILGFYKVVLPSYKISELIKFVNEYVLKYNGNKFKDSDFMMD